MGKRNKIIKIYSEMMTCAERIEILCQKIYATEQSKEIMILAGLSKEMAIKMLKMGSKFEIIFKI